MKRERNSAKMRKSVLIRGFVDILLSQRKPKGERTRRREREREDERRWWSNDSVGGQ